MAETPTHRELLITMLLTLTGGFADAGSYVLLGAFTGHVTGNALLGTIGLVTRHWGQARFCLAAVAAFMAGTVLGAAWRHPAGQARMRRLVWPLVLEIGLIGIGVLAGDRGHTVGRFTFLVCFGLSMGVQNGALNKLGPASVHSTYITGMSTSLVNSVVGGRSALEGWLLAGVIGCFVFGAALGAFCASRAGLPGFAVILLPLTLALILATGSRQ